MQQKKILLITGGAGYIGSHAVVAFEEAGYTTVILDNLVNSSRDALLGIEKILGYCPDFYECDIRDRDGLEKIFQKYDFDGVIHFAWLKSVDESCAQVSLYHENNVVGSVALFRVMEDFWVRKIVFSSSATVYASENISPIREDMILGTTNPYGTTKIIIEKILEDYSHHAWWSVMNLRYFNPVGAHISWNIGDAPIGGATSLLPVVLDVAMGKRESVSIYGNDYPTLDGTGVRDYIDINDLIDAHHAAYEALSGWFHVYNIGTWRWVSVLELIHEVQAISWQSIPYTVTPRRKWDLACVLADVEKISSELWWKSSRSFSDSIQSAWKFSQNSLQLR